MKREEILKIIQELSKSQGFYGRLLANLQETNEETRETIYQQLEDQNFKDSVDLIMYLEG